MSSPQPLPDVLYALQTLHAVCIAMDAENQHERPTESEYVTAMTDAATAIAAAAIAAATQAGS